MSLIPNYVPSGYKTINVFLQVEDAEKALAFYNGAFGAEILEKSGDHFEFKIADTILMMTESSKPSPSMLQLFTEDAAELIESVVKAGGEVVGALKEEKAGVKSGRVRDPFGNTWIITTSTNLQ